MLLEAQRGQPGLCGERWRPPTWHELRCRMQLSNVLTNIDACCFCLTCPHKTPEILGSAYISRLTGNRATSDVCCPLSFRTGHVAISPPLQLHTRRAHHALCRAIHPNTHRSPQCRTKKSISMPQLSTRMRLPAWSLDPSPSQSTRLHW